MHPQGVVAVQVVSGSSSLKAPAVLSARQPCQAHGGLSGLSCPFLPGPSFFLLLLQWRVGRSKLAGLRGWAESWVRPCGSAKAREVLGWLEPFWEVKANTPVLLSGTSAPHRLLRKLSFWACTWRDSCPLPLPFAYFPPLWGRKEEKEAKKAREREPVLVTISWLTIICGSWRGKWKLGGVEEGPRLLVESWKVPLSI